MMFDTPFLADRNKIGKHMQFQTSLSMEWKNCSRYDWDYQVGDQEHHKNGILCKSES